MEGTGVALGQWKGIGVGEGAAGWGMGEERLWGRDGQGPRGQPAVPGLQLPPSFPEPLLWGLAGFDKDSQVASSSLELAPGDAEGKSQREP